MKKKIFKVLLLASMFFMVGVGLAFIQHKVSDSSRKDNQQPSGNSRIEQNSELNQQETEADAENTIVFDEDGFRPAELTVTAGTTITIRNNSSNPVQFSSDEHPTHTDNQELNGKVLPPGASEELTLDTVGTWGFHDHLNTRFTGTITVE
jgi:plastocyanin